MPQWWINWSKRTLTQQIQLSDKIVKRQLTWIRPKLRREKEEHIRTYGLYEPKHELG